MTQIKITFDMSQVIEIGKDHIILDVPPYGTPKIAAYAMVIQGDDIKSAKYILVSNRNKLQLGGEEV